MEQQVEAQRNEFTQQLEEQRKALEEENLRRQQEMEARFQEQIHQAIQAHLPTPTAPTPPRHPPEEVAQRMENQDVRIQQLTDMIQRLLTRSPAEPPTQPARSSTGNATLLMPLWTLQWIIMIWRMYRNNQKFVEMTKVPRKGIQKKPQAEFGREHHINQNGKHRLSCTQQTLHVNDGPSSNSEHRK